MNVTIQKIFAALAAIVAGWKSPTNVENDIADGALILLQAENVDPNLAYAAVGLKMIQNESASMANVQSGQAAVLGTVGESFQGQPDKIMIIAVRQYAGATPPPGSPAETLKQLLGT